jgi:RNA polymerase sigma-70 factor (ECF subfamily)
MQFAQDVATLYADFRGRIYGYLRHLTQDEGLAEDLTQETFLRAGTHLDTFRGEGDIGNWLYRIATNLFRDYLRTQSGKPQHAGYEQEGTEEGDDILSQIPDPGPPPSHLLDSRVVTQCVHDCISALPPLYRAALVLYALEGKTVDEGAALLGCSNEAFKVRLHRGRRMFQALASERCDITAERGGAVDCQPKGQQWQASHADQL